jgi:hypothetical protein
VTRVVKIGPRGQEVTVRLDLICFHERGAKDGFDPRETA